MVFIHLDIQHKVKAGNGTLNNQDHFPLTIQRTEIGKITRRVKFGIRDIQRTMYINERALYLDHCNTNMKANNPYYVMGHEHTSTSYPQKVINIDIE